MLMRTPKITFNDLKDGIAVMDHYGIKGRDVEKEIRKHTEGMPTKQKQEFYAEFYKRRK